jgi:hypothetical protein
VPCGPPAPASGGEQETGDREQTGDDSEVVGGAWWGVVMAAGFCAWLSFRLRQLPFWVGALSAIAVALPVVFLALSGAVALAGAVGPIWLTVASLAMALRGRSVVVQALAPGDAF